MRKWNQSLQRGIALTLAFSIAAPFLWTRNTRAEMPSQDPPPWNDEGTERESLQQPTPKPPISSGGVTEVEDDEMLNWQRQMGPQATPEKVAPEKVSTQTTPPEDGGLKADYRSVYIVAPNVADTRANSKLIASGQIESIEMRYNQNEQIVRDTVEKQRESASYVWEEFPTYFQAWYHPGGGVGPELLCSLEYLSYNRTLSLLWKKFNDLWGPVKVWTARSVGTVLGGVISVYAATKIAKKMIKSKSDVAILSSMAEKWVVLAGSRALKEELNKQIENEVAEQVKNGAKKELAHEMHFGNPTLVDFLMGMPWIIGSASAFALAYTIVSYGLDRVVYGDEVMQRDWLFRILTEGRNRALRRSKGSLESITAERSSSMLMDVLSGKSGFGDFVKDVQSDFAAKEAAKNGPPKREPIPRELVATMQAGDDFKIQRDAFRKLGDSDSGYMRSSVTIEESLPDGLNKFYLSPEEKR